MGAVESLDHCCADRPDSMYKKEVFGKWRRPETKSQKVDLNRDYGNGAAICDDPLKDLKLDKSIDSELTLIFKEVGHRFPCPIHGQEQLTSILTALRKRGYFFPGTDDKLCARVWSMHNCSRITILQFRAWFHAELVVSEHNLRTLLGHSRWVSSMLERTYSECEVAEDKMEIVCKLINTLRQYLDEAPVCPADVHKTFKQVLDRSGKVNYLLSGRGKILMEDFEALVKEMLVELYYDYFSASLYSYRDEKDPTTAKQKLKTKTLAGFTSSGCCLPESEAGMDRWRNVSDSLPCGYNASKTLKSQKVPGGALPVGDDNRALARSLKFPVGSKVPVGAVAA
jgi:hypothetical protein